MVPVLLIHFTSNPWLIATRFILVEYIGPVSFFCRHPGLDPESSALSLLLNESPLPLSLRGRSRPLAEKLNDARQDGNNNYGQYNK